MPESQELPPVEIHLGRAQLLLATALVFVLVLGGLGVVAIEHLTTAHGYTLTVRCLPELHLNNSSYLFNGTYQFALPVATPTYLPYQEVTTSACELPAVTHVLSPQTKVTACLTQTAVTVAPGQSTLLICQPLGHPEVAAHLTGVCLVENRAFLGNAAGYEQLNGVCTLWVESATYHP